MSLERVLVHCVWVLNGRARILTAGVALVAITTQEGSCLGDPKFLPSCAVQRGSHKAIVCFGC